MSLIAQSGSGDAVMTARALLPHCKTTTAQSRGFKESFSAVP